MSQSPDPAAPRDVAPLLALATEFLRAGRPADAIAPLYEAALLQPSNPIIQHDLGLACLEVGRIPDAIAALQRAVASDPTYSDAYFRLGIALEKLGDIGGAIAAYDRATQLEPSLTEAWFRAGALVYTLGHRDQAIDCFRRAAETVDGLVAMAQCVDQGAGAEPRLCQGWLQLSRAVVRRDCPADVAQLLQGDSQAEICIAVGRIASDGSLQCRDGIRYAANLEAGEAEIVLDDWIGRL